MAIHGSPMVRMAAMRVLALAWWWQALMRDVGYRQNPRHTWKCASTLRRTCWAWDPAMLRVALCPTPMRSCPASSTRMCW